MSEDQTMRLVAELLDKTSGPLKDIQRSLKQTADIAKSMHGGGIVSTREHNKQYKEMRERVMALKEGVAGSLVPAMAVLGVTAYGTGEAIAAIAEKLKKAGESYNVLNDAARRGHVSVGYLTAMTVALERLGVAPDKARDSIASMGTHLSRIARGSVPELNALTKTFGNFVPTIKNALKGTTTIEQQITALTKLASEHPEVPIDKWVEFYQAIGGPAELATGKANEVTDAIKKGFEYLDKHPPNMAVYGELDKAFAHLRETQSGFGESIVNTFGDKGAKSVNLFADALDSVGGKLDWINNLAAAGKFDWINNLAAILNKTPGELLNER
jgi:hypothetical protein